MACQGSHHHCQASTMPVSERVPAAIATLEAASTSGSSYDISCAADRIPPSTEYLLPDDHPAMIDPSTPTPMTASTKNSPASRSTPYRPGPTGMTIITTRYGTSATAGAILKMARSAAAGMTSSFWTNFTPSAISCAQP
ncbi:hypothetical protein Amac_016720 [Acrocarpospora macrocephala]|uniref:Uncharacterized protein n=1 Tax=Acrocarpospora macrocephala TaxID=150177 RepID=A0A5M3WG48_9ACTN|nr:hypothetical protein Amac_016720 [Acrocarpospora macrocephala]